MRNNKVKEKREKRNLIVKKLLLSLGLTILVATISFVFIQLLQFGLDISLLIDFVVGNIPLVIMNIFMLWIIQWPFVLLLGNAIKSSFVFLFF